MLEVEQQLFLAWFRRLRQDERIAVELLVCNSDARLFLHLAKRNQQAHCLNDLCAAYSRDKATLLW